MTDRVLQVLARLVDCEGFEVVDSHGFMQCPWCGTGDVDGPHPDGAAGPCPWGEARKLLAGREDVTDLVDTVNYLQGQLATAQRRAQA